VVLEGERPLWRRLRADGSYGSSNDARVLFALGDEAPAALSVRVLWPDASEERWSGLTPDRYHQLRQGSGASPER
jgi:hypothetical protein